MLSCLTVSAIILIAPSVMTLNANGEEVIFIVPGSSDPNVSISFDPPLQIIQSGQEIVFANVDGIEHQLVVNGDNEVFDTGVLGQNAFTAHTFSAKGEYTIECQRLSLRALSQFQPIITCNIP